MQIKLMDIVNENLATKQEIYLISLLNINCVFLSDIASLTTTNTQGVIDYWGSHKFVINNGMIYGYDKDKY